MARQKVKARPNVKTRAQQLDELERLNNPHLYAENEEPTDERGRRKKKGGVKAAGKAKKGKKKGKAGKKKGRKPAETAADAAQPEGQQPQPRVDESRPMLRTRSGAVRSQQPPEEFRQSNRVVQPGPEGGDDGGEGASDGGGTPEANPLQPAGAPSPPASQGKKGFVAHVFDANRDPNQTFDRTGSCRNLTPREICGLTLVIFLAFALLLIFAPWDTSEDELLNPINDKDELDAGIPPSPRFVSAAFTFPTGEVLNPVAIPSDKFRTYGMTVIVSITGVGATPFDTTVVDPPFKDYVRFATSCDPRDAPYCFNARVGYFDKTARVRVLSGTQVGVYFPPGNGVQTHVRETVSMYFVNEGGVGFPITFTLIEEALVLPQSEQRVDAASKVASAGYLVSGFSPAGVSAGIGALPKLSLVTAAFNCPTSEFFEVEWIEHPLVLLGFPDIDIGGFPGLAPHIASMVGAYIIMGTIALVLVILSVVRQSTSGGHWRESSGAIGFPNYVTPFFLFLSPGVAVTTMSVLLHHPDGGAKAFAAFTFIFLVVAPLVYYVLQMTSPQFRDGLRYVQKRDNDPTMKWVWSRFVYGEHEWIEKPAYDDNAFLDRHGTFFQDYRVNSLWFLGLEAGVAICMGLAQATLPSTDLECRWRSWVLLGLNTIHFGGFIFLAPLLAKFEALYAFVLSGVLEAMLILIVINQGTSQGEEHWTAHVAGELGVAEVWLIKIKIVLDIVFALAECFLMADDSENVDAEDEEDEEEEEETDEERDWPEVPPSEKEKIYFSPDYGLYLREQNRGGVRADGPAPEVTIYCGGEVYRMSPTAREGPTPFPQESAVTTSQRLPSSQPPHPGAGRGTPQPIRRGSAPHTTPPLHSQRSVVMAHPEVSLQREMTPGSYMTPASHRPYSPGPASPTRTDYTAFTPDYHVQ